MNPKDIKFLEIRHLRGPNLWTYRPVIEAVVDIGEFEDYPSNTLPGFVERLTTLLPTLIEHRCSYGERGGFLRRLAKFLDDGVDAFYKSAPSKTEVRLQVANA